jgi:hypothetical protein
LLPELHTVLNITRRHIAALLLLIGFSASWMLRAGHALLDHHDHTKHLVCETAAKEGTFHIHDERYAPKPECSLCAFWFSVAELPAFPPEISVPVPDFSAPGQVFLSAVFIASEKDMAMRRGPPAPFA